MGRKKMDNNEKKVYMGITLDPYIYKLLEEQSEKEGLSKSSLIENILKDKINNK